MPGYRTTTRRRKRTFLLGWNRTFSCGCYTQMSDNRYYVNYAANFSEARVRDRSLLVWDLTMPLLPLRGGKALGLLGVKRAQLF